MSTAARPSEAVMQNRGVSDLGYISLSTGVNLLFSIKLFELSVAMHARLLLQ